MKNKWFILYKTFIYLTILFVVFTSSLTLFFQTSYGKNWLMKSLNEAFEKKEWEISFKGLGGILPFAWNISEVVITAKSKPILEAKNLYFRPYLWKLFKKELAFHEIWVDRAFIQTENLPPRSNTEKLELPFGITFRSFKASHLRFSKHPDINWKIDGKLRLYPFFEYVRGKIKIIRQDYPRSYIKATFRSEKIRNARLKANFQLDELKSLVPFVPIEPNLRSFDIKTKGTLQLDGYWEDFTSLFLKGITSRSLQGKIWGEVEKAQFLSENSFLEYLEVPWKYFSEFTLHSDFSLTSSFYSFKNKNLSLDGEAVFLENFFFDQTRFQFKTQNVTDRNPFSVELDGRINGEGTFKREETGYLLDMSTRSNRFHIDKYEFNKTHLHSKTYFSPEYTSSDLAAQTLLFSNVWNANFLLDFSSLDELHFNDLSLSSAFCVLEGSFTLQDKEWLVGSSSFSIDDLSRLEPFFPNYFLFGAADGFLEAQVIDQKQNIVLEANAFDLFSKPIHAVEGKASFELIDVYKNPSVKGEVNLQRVHVMGAELDQVYFSTDTSYEKWPFSLVVLGDRSISIDMQGYWLMGDHLFSAEVDKLSGFLFQTPFSASNPVTFLQEKQKLFLSPLEIKLPSSELYASMDFDKNKGEMEVKMEHFPMDFLSFNPFDIGVTGNVSLQLQAKKTSHNFSASLSGDIESATFLDLGEKSPLTTYGSFRADLEEGFATTDIKLFIREKENASLSCSFPLEIKLFPFSWKVPPHKKLFGELLYNAQAEDIFDYVNFGPHRFQGKLDCHLLVDGTKQNPHFQGKCELEKGKYQNYYTGANLENIDALFEAEKGKLYLKKCTGKDPYVGNFSAEGYIELDIERHLPYSISVDFTKLRLVNIPLVEADASGKVYVKGNQKKGLASGKVLVTNAQFTIPEKLPIFVPSLPITYINAPKAHEKQKVFYESKPAYPLELKMQVSAPGSIFIDGRGLTSEWNGDFLLGGTYSDIQTKGSLQLKHGDFVFSGKRFDLQEGLLTFTGKGSDLPYLSLSASLQQSEVTIIASLRGKINAPHLSFRSYPPMPVSSILSYLIFGQDISEISPLQVGQLAATAATLSGQGPDILTLTKRSLGIDRLAIVSTPSPEGGESPSLQVGKYLSKGILFSVSQGAAPSTSSVSVEVDLTHGFIFQAESLVQQEQGKFGLRWNHNY